MRGRVYIVTGGTGHLGREVCKRLAAEGATVYSISRDPHKFHHNYPGTMFFLQGDVTVEADVSRAVACVMDAEGRIDGLFNNASSSARGIDPEIPMNAWALGLDRLVSNYFLVARTVLRHMVRAESGTIVNNASLWGVVSPDPRMYLDLGNEPPIYLPCAKAGVIALTKYLAVLYADKGIRVNAVTPGLFPQKRGVPRPDYMRELESRIPMGRIGQAHEIAGPVCFLLSDASSYVTGQNLIVDGGYVLR